MSPGRQQYYIRAPKLKYYDKVQLKHAYSYPVSVHKLNFCYLAASVSLSLSESLSSPNERTNERTPSSLAAWVAPLESLGRPSLLKQSRLLARCGPVGSKKYLPSFLPSFRPSDRVSLICLVGRRWGKYYPVSYCFALCLLRDGLPLL